MMIDAELFARLCRVQADYARCLDDGNLHDWPGFFTEDCLYCVTNAQNFRAGYPAGLIYANSRAMLTDRITALHDANIYERHSYRHIFGQPSILEADAVMLRTETPFMVARIMRDGATDLFATGRMCDRYAVAAETLLLAERIVVCDSSRIDTLLAIPL